MAPAYYAREMWFKVLMIRQDSANPKKNVLPPGVDEAELLRAIDTSGYPLQGLVAAKLSKHFKVSEEWGYLDRDTQDHRTLDLHAFRNFDAEPGATVQPGLVLLVECKRSVHPFVLLVG
jgi:hypothetical protein